MEWELCPTQYSNDKFLTALHHSGTVTTDEHGVVFRCPNHIFCRMNKDITFSQLKEKAERKIRPEGGWRKDVERIRYKKYNCGDDGTVRYSVMEIRSDDDVRAMMEAHANIPMGRSILELYVDTIRTPEEIIHLLQPPPPQQVIPERVINHYCTLHCQAHIMSREEDGVYFSGPNTIYSRLKNNITFAELNEKLTEKAQLEGEEQKITRIVYRWPQIRERNRIWWGIMTIKTDNHVRQMFRQHEMFQPYTRSPIELCVETKISDDEIIRRIIPPAVRWPLPENVWWH